MVVGGIFVPFRVLELGLFILKVMVYWPFAQNIQELYFEIDSPINHLNWTNGSFEFSI